MLLDKSGIVDPSTLDPDLGTAVMYGGEVQVTFNPLVHRYVVSDVSCDGGKPFSPPSVTKVLGAMVDKSEPLTAWAGKCAQAKMLELIQPGRMYSAEELQTIGYYVKDAHKNVVKAACDVGHEFHEWVQNYLGARMSLGGFPEPPENTQVRNCARAARAWILQVDLKPFTVERILYSRKHRVIGTADVAGLSTINGRTAVIDWKSSKDLHTSYRFQTAVYRAMLHEMTGQWTDDR
jgi:hypothetical protein